MVYSIGWISESYSKSYHFPKLTLRPCQEAGLQKESSLPIINFQVLRLVSGRVVYPYFSPIYKWIISPPITGFGYTSRPKLTGNPRVFSQGAPIFSAPQKAEISSSSSTSTSTTAPWTSWLPTVNTQQSVHLYADVHGAWKAFNKK